MKDQSLLEKIDCSTGLYVPLVIRSSTFFLVKPHSVKSTFCLTLCSHVLFICHL